MKTVKQQIFWAIVHKDGYIFPDTIRELRREAVFQITRHGHSWNTFKAEGFRAVKVAVGEFIPSKR